MSISDKFNDLRKRAEALLPPCTDMIPEMSVESIQKLLHELEIYQIELEMQNKELLKALSDLEISRNKYLEIFDFAPAGYFIIDKNDLICKVNFAGADMLGTERRHLMQKRFSSFIMPEFKDIYYYHKKQIIEAGNRETVELKLLKPDRITSFYVLFKAVLIKESKGTEMIQIALTDIDAQKQAEMLVKKALSEKEALLREVHHRIKNNLQTLIYLIDMQKDTVKNKDVINALDDFQGRAKSIGMVHAMLYSSDIFSQIDFGVYIRELAEAQFYSMIYNRPISLYVKSADIKMSVDIAVPCGLIINELITNAVKYAFPDNKPWADDPADPGCKIQITFELKDDIYIMTFSDNGIGIPQEHGWCKSESLGLKLINLWGKYQLRGNIETDFSRGTKFIIKFPAK